MPRIMILMKTSGKLSCLSPTRRSATQFLARASLQSSGPSSSLSGTPGLGSCCSRTPTSAQHFQDARWLEGEERGSTSKLHLQSKCMDVIGLYVHLGLEWRVHTLGRLKQPAIVSASVATKIFSITVQELEMISIAFKVNVNHLPLESRLI